MERPNAWKAYSEQDQSQLESLAEDYIEFISTCKTERACCARAVEMARAAGYVSVEEARKKNLAIEPGTRLYAVNRGKAIMLMQVGEDSLENGFNVLGAHIDSPRLDLKQNPAFESQGFAMLDTHYYGGVKKYQWVTMPLAIHGVVAKTDGEIVQVNVGDDPGDPVFCITDLLIHLAGEQMGKKASEVVEGEQLDILAGSRPLVVDEQEARDAEEDSLKALAAKEPVKAQMLLLLREKYGFDEEDFLSAELEAVPSGRARSCGFDRSMVLGYGQDDRVCAYTSLLAQLQADRLKRSAVCILVDKEEIGSVGATGMTSMFFENTLADLMDLAGVYSPLALNRALASSTMLSSDVSAGLDPTFSSVFESKNAAFLGRGLVFNKYTGARGKSGSNDADAEYVARVRAVMEKGNVTFQTAELGKVDAGGGGTIAYIPAKYGMDVIDCGVAVLSMHAPWEVTSKADIYEALKGYRAFLKYC